jgi:hypothetical protein
VHLALDLVLMFPCGLGIKGAAISTAVSEWLAAGAYVALVWGKQDMLGLWPPPQLQPAQLKERCLPFLQVGVVRYGAKQCWAENEAAVVVCLQRCDGGSSSATASGCASRKELGDAGGNVGRPCYSRASSALRMLCHWLVV